MASWLDEREARPYCYRCDKPTSMCLCDRLTPVHNSIPVHVLQHAKERRHHLGTARLLRLGLADIRVQVLAQPSRSAAIAPAELPDGAGLLYPAEDALDLTTLAANERPSSLVVIDGTWSQAHRLFRDNPWISALPRYCLPAGEGSNYRIRPEPRLECLSTVESVVAALRILEPGLGGTEAILSAFHTMIDDQIEASQRRSPETQRFQVRRRPAQPIPDVLLSPGARLVVMYTEAAPRPAEESGPRPPVRISAATLDGARVFDRWIQSTPPPDAYLATRMEADLTTIRAGAPCPEVLTAFREFCGESRRGSPLVLLAWNHSTFRWFEGSMGAPHTIAIKGLWANLSRRRIPELEILVDTLGLTPTALPVAGRAGRRLAHAHALALHISSGAAHAS